MSFKFYTTIGPEGRQAIVPSDLSSDEIDALREQLKVFKAEPSSRNTLLLKGTRASLVNLMLRGTPGEEKVIDGVCDRSFEGQCEELHTEVYRLRQREAELCGALKQAAEMFISREAVLYREINNLVSPLYLHLNPPPAYGYDSPKRCCGESTPPP